MEQSGVGTIGDALRREREAKHLSIEVVHRATKISPEMIRALEEDDHGVFSSEVYLKSFLRTYASYLGLSGDELWSTLMSRRGESVSGEATWDVEESLHEEKLEAPRWPRRVLLAVLVGIIVVLAALLIQQRRRPSPAVGTTVEEAPRGAPV